MSWVLGVAALVVLVTLWCAVRRADRIRAPMAEDYGEPIINRGQFTHALRDPGRPPYDDPGAKL
jgi:hypothetical protein